MKQTLFDVLTDSELNRLKTIGQTRNVLLKDLTIGELVELIPVFWPDANPLLISDMDVLYELKQRKAI